MWGGDIEVVAGMRVAGCLKGEVTDLQDFVQHTPPLSPSPVMELATRLYYV